jgi:hypothetical protein
MSSSSAYEIAADDVTEEIWEQQIIIRFDYLRRRDGPQIVAVILCSLNFGVVAFVGIDCDEAQVGDVAIEIAHNGFCTHVQVWLKLRNGARGWGSTSEYRGNITTLHTLHKV